MQVFVVRFWCNGTESIESIHRTDATAKVGMQRAIGRFKANTPDIVWRIESEDNRDYLLDSQAYAKHLKDCDLPDNHMIREDFETYHNPKGLYIFEISEHTLED